MNNKNNKYKNGAFSDDDEDQKMPDASGFYDLFKSKRRPRQGTKFGYVNQVETETDLPADKPKVILPSETGEDPYEAVLRELRAQKLELAQIKSDLKLEIKMNAIQNTKIDDLNFRLAQERMDRLHLYTNQAGRAMEASSRDKIFTWLGEVCFGDPARLQHAVQITRNDRLRSWAETRPSVKKLLEITRNSEFRVFFEHRNAIAHPPEIRFDQVESLLEELGIERHGFPGPIQISGVEEGHEKGQITGSLQQSHL